MRLKILIEDIEYRDALIEALSKSEKNVYIELIDSIDEDWFTYGTILLTDIPEDLVIEIAGVEYASRIIVLTACQMDCIKPDSIEENKVNRVFKFQNASFILAQIAELNTVINGNLQSRLVSTSKYIVCGNSTEQCSLFSNILARQIRFRHGGNIMILSLTYINSHPISEERDCGKYARMMYLRSVGRAHSQDLYTYTDLYGITYLRLPVGNNPLAFMSSESLISLCSYLCDGVVDTLILDIGSEFSSRNQSLFKLADDILIVNRGGRSTDWNTFQPMNTKEIKQKTISFSDVDIELNLDDYLRDKYGVIIEDEEPQSNSKAIRRRDRQARNRG